ncbi:hypothetical protein A2Y85_05510 [candidate division WOR-3 bacterium RBG_13_43_14]|uniref:Swt1-like HEPN domain-containing protein n=1 Tax=candidate division WOR-3 bacterium RBG_13_43_14 TaxID=1802590 RepID=A0A1F4UF70_UNCW3|nr:MAG: hypothetical protein A2Y85_05510 [candidate division WOR-3 bacterium RBG_13_43_14]
MPSTADFRLSKFDSNSVGRSGKFIGRQTYWKLYSIENIFRVVIHSVLSAQLLPNDWWMVAVDTGIQKKAQSFQSNYVKKSWHGKPGSHSIYYIDLKDLNEIIRANANLFLPVIPDLDKWMVGIEELRLPRNVVAHMNFPNNTDMKRIDVFHDDCVTLITVVENKIALLIP